jgi:hypothetical protein
MIVYLVYMGWTVMGASFMPTPANSASGGRQPPDKASPSSPEILAVLLEFLDELPADFLKSDFQDRYFQDRSCVV